MKKILGLLLIAAIVVSTGCKEDFEDAPFRCKINGDDFTTSDDLLTVTITGDDNFYIQATRVVNPLNDDLYGEIKLDITVDSLGTYPLNLQNTWRWSNNGDQTYRANGIEPGTVTITQLDHNAKRISGTFELVAVGDNGSTKTVTEGFFDSDWN